MSCKRATLSNKLSCALFSWRELFLKTKQNGNIMRVNNFCSNRATTRSLFKDQSSLYAKYRPSYDTVLYSNIISYTRMNSNDSQNTAVDVATGTGQAAIDLRNYYDKVIAIDIQENQLKHAFKDYDNIQFKEGVAENITLESNSVDLVCTAQALHWFDVNKFYIEANRILKKNGTLAIWGYNLCYITPNGANDNNKAIEASNLISNLYKNDKLSKYWDQRRYFIDSHYTTISPTEDDKLFKNIEKQNLFMSKRWKLSDVVKYISTWSAYNTYMKANKIKLGSNDDPCVIIENKLKQVYDGEDCEITISWPIFLILATKY